MCGSRVKKGQLEQCGVFLTDVAYGPGVITMVFAERELWSCSSSEMIWEDRNGNGIVQVRLSEPWRLYNEVIMHHDQVYSTN